MLARIPAMLVASAIAFPSMSAADSLSAVFLSSWPAVNTTLGFHAGEVFVIDSQGKSIRVFDSAGNFRRVLSGYEHTDRSYPSDIAFGSGGNVYVSDQYGGRVEKLSLDGALLGAWAPAGPEDAAPPDRFFLAVDPSENVYVVGVDSGGTVRKFDSNGNFLAGWDLDVIPQYRLPAGAVVGPDSRLYIVNQANQIVVYEPDGTFVDSWTLEGIVMPAGLANDSAGRLYVTDYYDTSVGVFDPSGSLLGGWDYASAGAHFGTWIGIAVEPDGGAIYVGDYNRDVLKFAPAPVVAKIGTWARVKATWR